MFCALTRSLYEEQTSLGDLSRADLHIWGIFTASTKIFPHLVFPLNLITIVYVLSNEASRSTCFSTRYFSLLAGTYLGTSLEVKMAIVLRLNMWMSLDPAIPHLGI